MGKMDKRSQLEIHINYIANVERLNKKLKKQTVTRLAPFVISTLGVL